MVLQNSSSSTPHHTHSAFKVPTPLAARPTLVTTYIFPKLYTTMATLRDQNFIATLYCYQT
jgi:hypothetical protein